MALDGIHWLIGFLVALLMHAAGLMFIDAGQRTIALEEDGHSDEIVVLLGRGSGNIAETAKLLNATLEARQAESPAAIPNEAVSEVAKRVRESTMINDQVPAPDQSRRDQDVETVSALEARGIDSVKTEPETVPAQTSMTVDSVAVLDIATEPELQDDEVDSPAPADAGTPSPEIIEIVAPETLLVKESEPRLPAAQIAAEIGTAPAVDPVDEADAPRPDADEVAPSAVASIIAPEVDANRPAPAVDSSPEVAAVLDLETVESLSEVDQTTTAYPQSVDTETLAVPEEQVVRAVTLEELQQRSGGEGVVAGYAGLLKARLQENMHYPRAARLSGQEGRAVVRFLIDRQGSVLSIELEQGSGYPLLDREAVEMIQRADPFPEMPAQMLGANLELRVPVAFEIKDKAATRNVPPINLE